MILDLSLLLCIVIIAVTGVSIIHDVCPLCVCVITFLGKLWRSLTDTSDVEEINNANWSQTMH